MVIGIKHFGFMCNVDDNGTVLVCWMALTKGGAWYYPYVRTEWITDRLRIV